MSDNSESLVNLPQEIVTKEVRHIADGEPTYTLYALLLETKKYIDATPDNTSAGVVSSHLINYYNKVVDRLQQDNRDTQAIPDQMIQVCKAIVYNSKFSINHYAPSFEKVILCLIEIYTQFKALYINSKPENYTTLYKNICTYTESVTDDLKEHYNAYNTFTRAVYDNYILAFQKASNALSTTSNDRDRNALYNLLFQMDQTIVDLHTEIQPLVNLLIAVQNNRIFRNRETTIIAIKDSISMINMVRVFWYIEKLNYHISAIPSNEIYDDWEKVLEGDDLDRIQELLEWSKTWVKETQKASEQASNITSAMQTITQQAVHKNAITSLPELLEWINTKVETARVWLNNLKLQVNYDFLQNFLDKMGVMAERIRNWLSNNALVDLFNKINEILATVKQITDTIRNVMCLIRQALCMIAGIIHLKESVILPIINNLKAVGEQMAQDLTNTINVAVDTFLKPVNNATKRLVFEMARAKLNARLASISSAIGQPIGESTKIKSVIDGVINTLLGIEGYSGLEYLKNTATQQMKAIEESFKQALSPASAVNCPPITLPNLVAPNLSLLTKLPTITSIELNISC